MLRLLVPCTVALVVSVPRSAAAQETRDTVALHGLTQPVEILRDAWGIAHIYAQNEHDLFFAQGFNAARDRLFQLEIWRRNATGTMAELVGRRALDHDIGARLLSFRGPLREEMAHYHPRGAAIISAFVEGINAYIALTERTPALLPVEFAMLDFKPGRWTPAIVISRHNGLFRNAFREVELAKIVAALGSERARTLLDLHPGNPILQLDSAIDPARLDDVFRSYRASRSAIRFDPEDVVAEYRAEGVRHGSRGGCSAADDLCRRRLAWLLGAADPESDGSNNWVVAGAHTFTGAAMMANDPHRVLALPSLRYWVHLVAPGWNVIGGGEPALPGVAIGHNEFGGWGLTIFAVDQEDLYVYETNPATTRQYRYGGRWIDMEVVRDEIVVRGEEPVTVEFRFTRHGPVLHQDSAVHEAYALRAAWLEVGTAPYLASLRMDQARTWEEFRAASAFFRTPSENMVWADRAGNIGWQATGIAPRRRGWDGLLPVPGDGRYEWEGFLPILELPHRVNPPEGWIATANENNLPAGFQPVVGYEWSDPFRVFRVQEVLAAGRRLTLMDMQRLQHDELSLPARSLIPLLEGLQLPDAARDAAERLLQWDHVLGTESVAATIYAAWERRLRDMVLRRVAPEEARDLVDRYDLSLRKMIEWLTVPDGRLGAHPTRARDELLISSLEEVVAELAHLMGPDQATWRYGLVKQTLYQHPLSRAVKAEYADRFDVGPLPRGGYGYTVNNTSNNLTQTHGATFRIIVDTGDWDRSAGTNAPGQSGDPASPHYADLFPSWASGRYFPVLYTRTRIESAVSEVTILVPRR